MNSVVGERKKKRKNLSEIEATHVVSVTVLFSGTASGCTFFDIRVLAVFRYSLNSIKKREKKNSSQLG